MSDCTQEESQILSLGRAMKILKNSPGWHRLRSEMEKWADEARETVRSNFEADKEKLAFQVIRWQQRESVVNTAKAWIDEQIQAAENLQDELNRREQDGNTDSYAQ